MFGRRRLLRRPWLRRCRLRPWEQLLLSVLAGLLLAAAGLSLLAGRLRPMVFSLAAAGVDNAVRLAVNQAMAQDAALGAEAYGELISLELDDSGRIAALRSDMGRANLLRSHIMHRLAGQLDQLTREELRIPVGSLTGHVLLSGVGPDLPVRVLSAGSASARFENQFSAAGINQTRHQIVLWVEVELYLLLPGGVTPHTVRSQVTLAETVLLGQVPQTYADFG